MNGVVVSRRLAMTSLFAAMIVLTITQLGAAGSSITSDDDMTAPDDDVTVKRAPSFRLGKRPAYDDNEADDVIDQDDENEAAIVRRAPSFRLGKRQAGVAAPPPPSSVYYYYRRSPSFRLGKRGVRQGGYDGQRWEEEEKRAPTFRLGRRGASSIGDNVDDLAAKRAPSFRLG